MSEQVLIDRDMLEEAAKWLELHSCSAGDYEAYAAKDLRDALLQSPAPSQPVSAQPAECCPVCDQGLLLRAKVCNACEAIITDADDARTNKLAVAHPAGEVPAGSILVGKAELAMVRSALMRDSEGGRPVRGEMLKNLDDSIAQHTRIVAALQSDADRWKFYAPKVAELMGITIEYMTAEIDEARLNGKGGV